MTAPFDDGGVQAVYDFWLGLIPQFFGLFGGALPTGDKAKAGPVPGTVDMSAWLGPWGAAMPLFPDTSKAGAGGTAASAAQSMFGPWAAMFAPYSPGHAKTAQSESLQSGATAMFAPWMAGSPFFPGAPAGADGAVAANAALQPLQAAQQAWLDFAARMGAVTPENYLTGIDRTFGGLFDALGFGPMRKLQAGWQDLAAAALAQNESRATYAVLVQGAFAAGLERLMTRLAQMADGGERVDSVLALLRLWAVSTEQAVHEVLQSEQGLAATAALARASVTHRRKLQHVAGIVADSLDMATRRELDEAFREILDLKRELRALRSSAPSRPAAAAKTPGRTEKRKSK
jgi:hypothetical protein